MAMKKPGDFSTTHGTLTQHSSGGAPSALVPSKSRKLHWYFTASLGFCLCGEKLSGCTWRYLISPKHFETGTKVKLS